MYNNKSILFLFINTVLSTISVNAMDLSASTIFAPKQDITTTFDDYKKELNSLMALVNSPSHDSELDIAEKLVSLKACAQTESQKAAINNLNETWTKESDPTKLKIQFSQLYNSIQAKDLSICIERFHNQLTQKNKNNALETLKEIESLLPVSSTLRQTNITTIRNTLNSPDLDQKLIKNCLRLMKTIEDLSFPSGTPNTILENSFIAQKQLAQDGTHFPTTNNTADITSYILAQPSDCITDSLKIYILQLMWSSKMEREGNRIVQSKSLLRRTQATIIAHALRSMACKKNAEGQIEWKSVKHPPRKNIEIRTDSCCESNELYHQAILPSIKHNTGKVATFKYHDKKENKKLLDKLLTQTNLDENFLNFLKTIVNERDQKIPHHDATQPYRKPDNSIVELAKKSVDSKTHFPLTEDSLYNPNAPELFKLLLKQYLTLHTQSPEEKKQNIIKQKIKGLQERLNFLKNYINLITNPKKIVHPYLNSLKKEDLLKPKIHSKVPAMLKLCSIKEFIEQEQSLATQNNSLSSIEEEIKLLESRISLLESQLTTEPPITPIEIFLSKLLGQPTTTKTPEHQLIDHFVATDFNPENSDIESDLRKIEHELKDINAASECNKGHQELSTLDPQLLQTKNIEITFNSIMHDTGGGVGLHLVKKSKKNTTLEEPTIDTYKKLASTDDNFDKILLSNTLPSKKSNQKTEFSKTPMATLWHKLNYDKYSQALSLRTLLLNALSRLFRLFKFW